MQGGRPLALVDGRPVHPHHIRPRGNIVTERTQDPLGGLRDVSQRGECRPGSGQSFGIIGDFLAEGAHLRRTRGSGGAQRDQRRRQRLGQHVQAPGAHLRQHPAEPVGRFPQLVQGVAVGQLGGPAGRGLGAGNGQLVGGGRGDPADQVVRLVDDDHVVLGQHDEILKRVDREQGVVGDHDVHKTGLLTGLLGEAFRAVRAAGRANALPGADRDLPPRPVLHPGHQFVPVAGLGGRGPLVQPLHLPAHRGHGGGVEQRLPRLLLGPAVQPVLA